MLARLSQVHCLQVLIVTTLSELVVSGGKPLLGLIPTKAMSAVMFAHQIASKINK
jgi:hypothetical protein